MKKPQIMWALVRGGHIFRNYVRPTRVEVIDRCTRSATPANTREKIMRQIRKEGFRVAKVEVREIDNG